MNHLVHVKGSSPLWLAKSDLHLCLFSRHLFVRRLGKVSMFISNEAPPRGAATEGRPYIDSSNISLKAEVHVVHVLKVLRNELPYHTLAFFFFWLLSRAGSAATPPGVSTWRLNDTTGGLPRSMSFPEEFDRRLGAQITQSAGNNKPRIWLALGDERNRPPDVQTHLVRGESLDAGAIHTG